MDKEEDKQKLPEVRSGVGKEGEKEEKDVEKRTKKRDHPLNDFANGLREFSIGILDLERSAVAGIRNLMRDWRDGSVSNSWDNYVPQRNIRY